MIVKQENEILFYEIVKTSFNKKELNKEIQKIIETDEQIEFLNTALYLLKTIPPRYSCFYWFAVCRYYEINEKLYGVDENVNYKDLEPLTYTHRITHPEFGEKYIFTDERIDEIEIAVSDFEKQCKDIIKSLEEKKGITKPQQPDPEPLDLSDTSAVEKIIYLNELGIIDFLRTKPEFIGSTNLMATVLSAVTDVKPSTLQTSLNRLIGKDTADKNHPYHTSTTVEKVRQTLINKNIKLKAS
jgi:hypothetical protein